MKSRRNNIVTIQPSKEPEIGRWLWAMQDARERTMEELEAVTPAMIDWLPPNNDTAMGSVLYHIAIIEADWLYFEVLEQPFPPQVETLFPYDIRDKQGHLTQVWGVTLEQHLQRLETVRALLLDIYQSMDLAEFRRVRALEDYDVTPEWVLHHLLQHEAEHRSQIGSLRINAARALNAG